MHGKTKSIILVAMVMIVSTGFLFAEHSNEPSATSVVSKTTSNTLDSKYTYVNITHLNAFGDSEEQFSTSC